jgi:hypothetical protein
MYGIRSDPVGRGLSINQELDAEPAGVGPGCASSAEAARTSDLELARRTGLIDDRNAAAGLRRAPGLRRRPSEARGALAWRDLAIQISLCLFDFLRGAVPAARCKSDHPIAPKATIVSR